MSSQRHPYRWRLHRAGITNVWHYLDTEFDLSGGRLVLRGTNGSGKSRALEMLLPFVLDADRRKMDATGANKVKLQDLMAAGHESSGIRLGYLWLELAAAQDNAAQDDAGQNDADQDDAVEYLTVGAFIRFSPATKEAKVWYFTTPLRIGVDVQLLGPSREVLPYKNLTELIGADRITDVAGTHRERVREQVFGLTGVLGQERFGGLLQLLHTLRSPDVGNRIEEGRLPALLSEALPPLSEATLDKAGSQLDGLSETRAGQQRLDESYTRASTFMSSYRRYVASVLERSAEAVRAAAETSARAQRHADERDREHRSLEERRGSTQARVADLSEQNDELSATIEGIRSSKEYAAAGDLDERGRRVKALRQAASTALSSAENTRRSEQRATDAADARADEASAAAAAAHTALNTARSLLSTAQVLVELPEGIQIEQLPGEPQHQAVRVDVDAAATAMVRPHPHDLRVVPNDVRAVIEQVRRVGDSCEQRARHAGTRLDQARKVAALHVVTEREDATAQDVHEQAETAAAEADAAAEYAAQAHRTLVSGWRDWTSSEVTREILGPVEWARTAVGRLLAPAVEEQQAFDGPEGLFSELDRAAALAATDAQEAHARERALVDAESSADARTRQELEGERRALGEQQDPVPEAPSWLRAISTGTPLWRLVDFADGVPDELRAGIEGALLAAGVLTAQVAVDASLASHTGQLLVAPQGPIAARPLSAALRIDQDAVGVSAEVKAAAEAVLHRIALDDPSHGIWVAGDGSWGNGPTLGRHRPTVARHIGAAARAAARAERLAQIEQLLIDLDAAAHRRRERLHTLDQARRRLRSHVAAAPRSQEAATATALVAQADKRAERMRGEAARCKEAAERARHAWTTALRDHRAACAQFSLPDSVDDLTAARQHALDAGQGCRHASTALVEFDRRLLAHAGAVELCAAARVERARVESQAEDDWAEWHHAQSALEAAFAALGTDPDVVLAELADAEGARRAVAKELERGHAEFFRLGEQVGAARSESANARERVQSQARQLLTATHALRTQLRLDGLWAAATSDPSEDPAAGGVAGAKRAPDVPELADASTSRVDEPHAVGHVSPTAARRFVSEVLAHLDRHGEPVDATALMKARQRLEQDSAGYFDVTATQQQDVWIVTISDANGSRAVADAVLQFRRDRDQGRLALSERERRVFTEFVLDGVGEELRRRLIQAGSLIDAMNASLSTIVTSHGIRVQLRWGLDTAASPALHRIIDLVRTAGAVRTSAQNSELADLLHARVDEAHHIEATAGYAAHLKSALDYRDWHHVEVIIHGPAPGQTRPISRRAKLSQGETRFVSYVTLFAAVDAYLSSLPDDARPLRLLLLDDAFAKVDERTIGELMGLLVHMDLDFVMTGHSLWGCYPQVPALDCYEVRRREGSAAVTTHIHWDGRRKHHHLRPT